MALSFEETMRLARDAMAWRIAQDVDAAIMGVGNTRDLRNLRAHRSGHRQAPSGFQLETEIVMARDSDGTWRAPWLVQPGTITIVARVLVCKVEL